MLPIPNATSPNIVIASDSFKGSAESVEIADAIIRGWQHRLDTEAKNNQSSQPNMPQPEFTIIPMADGGEGTLDALEYVWKHSTRQPITVVGPNNQPVDSYWLANDDQIALVELANTSGLLLAHPLDPFHCHSFGFGQALASAIHSGATTVYAGIGGSASNDGGLGLLAALGVRFFDALGTELLATEPDFGNAMLSRITRVDASEMTPLPVGGIRVISDVSSPLLGPTGAAAVFGPQKGASTKDIPELEHNLALFATTLTHAFPNADPTFPGSGAAGGCGFALHAIGAELLPGSVVVSETLGLQAAIGHADLVITGEGKYDSQSSQGKAVQAVKALADAANIPTVLIAGGIESDTTEFAAAFSLTEIAGSVEEAIKNPLHWLALVGEQLPAVLETNF